MRHIVRTWWPLALSWLLMAIESPAVSAIVARLAEPQINLAAFGGLVWPLALIIESPILMLLSASTALSKDWDSYLRLHRFTMRAGAVLTALHVLIIFTPLYYTVAVKLIGAPAEIVEPARLGLMVMIPWTWSVAYRRFNQGVLIRFGHSRAVGLGTLVRLSADALVLAAGYLIGLIHLTLLPNRCIIYPCYGPHCRRRSSTQSQAGRTRGVLLLVHVLRRGCPRLRPDAL